MSTLNIAGITITIEGALDRIGIVQYYFRCIQELPQPGASGLGAAEMEATEARLRFEMTRGLRFRIIEALRTGNKKAVTDLRKLLGDIMSMPLSSDQMWYSESDGDSGMLPKSVAARALSGDIKAIAQVIEENRRLRGC